MFFLATEARPLYTKFDPAKGAELFARLECDQAILRHGNQASLYIDRPQITFPTMRDAPRNFDLHDYREGYVYVTEQYVTHDYSRFELLRLAYILRTYDPSVIERFGNVCKKATKKFTIPYLAGALEKEAGAKEIEDLRTEQRLDEVTAQTPRLELPPYRPEGIRERMGQIAQERQIDDALHGRNLRR